jgi:hypothetical protein
MTLADRHIARFTNHQATMMQIREHIGQLDQFLETIQIPIASALLQIADEWRAVDGGKYLISSADDHITRSVARNLGELPRRGLAQSADLSGLHAHPIPVNSRAGLAPNLKRLGIIAKRNANVLHQPINLGLKLRQSGVV